jgi:hypothetical protein
VGSLKFLVFTKQSPGPPPSLLLPLNPLCPLLLCSFALPPMQLPSDGRCADHRRPPPASRAPTRRLLHAPDSFSPSLSCPTCATASPEHLPATTASSPRKAHRRALNLYLSRASAPHQPLHSVPPVPLPILEHPTQIPLPPLFSRSGNDRHCRGQPPPDISRPH